MRIFIALDIDEAIRERIVRFMEGTRGFAPDARWVRPESLHVTLKFIGEKSQEAVSEIVQALGGIRDRRIEVSFSGCGFFPTANSARVFWLGISAGLALGALARTIDERLALIGVAKEEHPYTPHLTLARGAGRSGSPQREKRDRRNRRFEQLQAKLAALPAPDFGTMTAREFFLYESCLSPRGSNYTKLSAFALE
jgi:RNA 2',3'-cyclic 3'-phosphodiesterase